MSQYTANPITIMKDLGKRRSRFTPDFLEMNHLEDIVVFVYGTLQKSECNDGILKDAKFLGQGYTLMDNFYMKEAFEAYPVVFDLETKSEAFKSKQGKILGELYAVHPRTILAMDNLERNGYLFKRKKKWIVCQQQTWAAKDGTLHNSTVHAWMYFLIPGAVPHDKLRQVPVYQSKAGKSYYTWNS